MSLQTHYSADAQGLDIVFFDNLDVTVSGRISGLCQEFDPEISSCIVDLTHAKRVFFSGFALLRMLHRKLIKSSATVVYLTNRPEVRAWVPVIVNGQPRTALLPPLSPGEMRE